MYLTSTHSSIRRNFKRAVAADSGSTVRTVVVPYPEPPEFALSRCCMDAFVFYMGSFVASSIKVDN